MHKVYNLNEESSDEETNETVISQDAQDSIAAQFNNKVRELSTTDDEEEERRK